MSLASATATATINPWVEILGALEKKVNRHSYETWLKPTRYSHIEQKKIFVHVPSPEFRQAGERYADLIQEAIEALGLAVEDVEFITPEDSTPRSAAAESHRHSNAAVRADGAFAPVSAHGHSANGRPSQARFDWETAAQLNPRYTFDAFVIGSGNQFAHAAAQAVA